MKYRFSMSSIWVLALLLIAFPADVRSQQQAGESSCIQCHAGMEGNLGQPVELWRGSVHAKNGVACQGCHGGDPTVMDMEAMNPEKGFKGVPKPEQIPEFCGQCHLGVKEDYLASAHGQALTSGGPQCVTCHGNHGIQLASLQLINEESCTRCHGFERAALIREALAETDAQIVTLDTNLKSLHRVGFAVGDLRNSLFDTRNTFHRLFHSVDVQKVHNSTADIQSRLKEIRQKADSIQDRVTKRKQAGVVVVALLLVLSGLFFYLRHTYKLEEKGGPR